MMNDDLIAALERAAAVLSWETPADADTIRAHITDLRAGNLVRREDGAAQERAKVVAWLRKRGDCWSTDDEIADAVEAGAHEGGGDE